MTDRQTETMLVVTFRKYRGNIVLHQKTTAEDSEEEISEKMLKSRMNPWKMRQAAWGQENYSL